MKIVLLKKFGGETISLPFNNISEDTATHGGGHGGGDYYIIMELYDMLMNKTKSNTSLETSVESHLMALCAEQSA